VVKSGLEAAEEAGVFGVVVGAEAEEFAEFREDGAVFALDEGSVAGWAGVSAGSSVAVSGDPAGFFGGWGWGWGWGVGEEAGCGGGTGRHEREFIWKIGKLRIGRRGDAEWASQRGLSMKAHLLGAGQSTECCSCC
jgi:hypothetical protein